jgi:hypothetical protein
MVFVIVKIREVMKWGEMRKMIDDDDPELVPKLYFSEEEAKIALKSFNESSTKQYQIWQISSCK